MTRKVALLVHIISISKIFCYKFGQDISISGHYLLTIVNQDSPDAWFMFMFSLATSMTLKLRMP